MIYTIFNQLTGQILRIVTTIDIDSQININESYVDGIYDDSLYYIQNNQPVVFPKKPNEYAIFDWSIHQWVSDINAASSSVLNTRNKLLYDSDWTQLPNGPLTQEVQQEWAVYRQALRDITTQSGYPFNVIWPVPPA